MVKYIGIFCRLYANTQRSYITKNCKFALPLGALSSKYLIVKELVVIESTILEIDFQEIVGKWHVQFHFLKRLRQHVTQVFKICTLAKMKFVLRQYVTSRMA